jgi:ADP-ribosylglycohydrolase
MASSTLVERIHGACQGVRIGDAFGRLPEGRTRAQILALTEGKGVWSYVVPGILRPAFDGPDGAPGDTTDDWAQTQMVIDSLCEKRRFDLGDIADRHVAASDWPYGWGGTTKAAIAAIKAGRSPKVPPPRPEPGEGAGNGPAMKVMPLAWLHGLRAVRGGFSAWDDAALRALCDDVVALSFMTHGDPLPAIAAVALAEIGAHLILGSCTATPTYEGTDEARNLVDGIARRLGKREHPVFAAMDAHGEHSPCRERLSGRIRPEDLRIFLEHLSWAVQFPAILGTDGKPRYRRHLTPADDAEIFAGRFVDPFVERMAFCRSIHSVAAAIAVFVRHSSRGQAAAHVAVNMGGDTDTVASMALALVGTNGGSLRLPRELMDARPDLRDEAARQADRFCAAFRVPGFRAPGVPSPGSPIV